MVPAPGLPAVEPTSVDPAVLRQVARTVALEAADLVRRGRADGVEVSSTKSSPTDVVTEVDRASERFLRQRLAELRPGDGFLGEEGGSQGSRTGVSWVVDPIDGTVNFLYGLPPYAVSVAAVAAVAGEVTGEPQVLAGAVVNVATGELFTAAVGQGATLDDRPLRVRPRVPLGERLVLTGFHYVREVRRAQGLAVARMLPQVRDVRRLGSAALDLCSLAAGRADAYVEEGLELWDRAAGGLVALEAGARLESRVGVGGRLCFVCAPEDGFEEFAALVQQCGLLAEGPAGRTGPAAE